MLIQDSHDVFTADKIFVVMFSGDTTNAITRGQLLSIDYTDNTAGPLGQTLGARVRVCPRVASADLPRWDIVGVAENSVPVAIANVNGPPVLIQVYGAHDAVRFDPGGIAAGVGHIQIRDTAGGADGDGVARDMTAITLGSEPEVQAGIIGVSFSAASGIGNYSAFVRCM